MDKYQEYVFSNISAYCPTARSRANGSTFPTKDTDTGCYSFNFDKAGKKITIQQNENYHLTKYQMAIGHPALAKVGLVQGDKEETAIADEKHVARFIVDFNSKIQYLKLYFINDIVDPVEVPVEFIDADQSKWNQFELQQNRKDLFEKVSIIVKFGDSFANVFYASINDANSFSSWLKCRHSSETTSKYLFIPPT